MKRRDFLVKSTAAVVGLASSEKLLHSSTAGEGGQQGSTQVSSPPTAKAGLGTGRGSSVARVGDTAESKFPPKPPVFAASRLSPEVKISPMTLEERLRRGIVPRRGFCSTIPGTTVSEGLTSGNGAMVIEATCDPYSEQILFHHESLLMPWKRPFEAPKAAEIFPQVRQMILEGKYKEAIELAFKEMDKGPVKVNTFPHPTVPAFTMRLDLPKTAAAKDYLRTVNFESGEVNAHWSDERGDWVRRTFASRPDNVVVQWLTAPKGQSVNARIAVEKPAARMRMFGGAGGTSEVQHDFNEQRLIYKCRLDPAVDNSGYAGVVRVARNGGSARMDGDTLVVENASSVTLLTRIEWFAETSEDKVEALRQAVEQLSPEYDAILERHRKVQSEAMSRVTVDFGGASQYGMSSEELLADQRSRQDYSPALLEKIFEMGRYWFMYTSGKYCSMAAEVNANINLQIAPGVQADLREGMDAYFNWMESLAPDFRVNAKNIFGMRGTHYSLCPQQGVGVAFHYSTAASTGEIWPHPYWLSAGGWCLRPFWDHYLVTGDVDFLRNRVVPAYKELALFYEDFLTVTGKDGNYIFVPSFSPENNPANTSPSAMLVINATMDIAVCREVLTNLIEACEVLGSDAGSIPKWKAMLAKMPPYLMEPDGTLKEWAWPTLEERYSHRHISHLYGAWPGDEIDPDRTPKLALAAMMADRRRVPERLAAHGRCHRALVGARLKDCYMVDTELRQLIEQGYVATTLRCSHDPWAWPMPDAQGGIPTIMMEMLLYSRPGVIEILPAVPNSLEKGSIHGMLAKTFARVDRLAWDMPARTADLAVTSLKDQEIKLIIRHGIEKVTAPAGVLAKTPKPEAISCDLRLKKGEPARLHLTLGRHKPLDWVARATES
ncbi:MAG TPA: glycoside hydrolase N-terminal domain-containing protein [Terracidiphilus sp.]|nr:glycoside hydrolase N-terminal domain-containing protein [Terracidiphilus sp.]